MAAIAETVEGMPPEELCGQKEAVKALANAVSELARKPGARSYAVTTYYNTGDDEPNPNPNPNWTP